MVHLSNPLNITISDELDILNLSEKGIYYAIEEWINIRSFSFCQRKALSDNRPKRSFFSIEIPRCYLAGEIACPCRGSKRFYCSFERFS